MRVYAVVNTKGGTGKSTVAWQILPAIITNSKVIEIDNNNKTIDVFRNSEISGVSKTITLKDAQDALGEILFDMLEGKDETVIIDAGGGDDTKKVIETIKELDFDDIEFIIPLMGGMAQKKNAEDTYEMVKDRGKVYFFLNRFSSEEFAFWYGSEELGIAPSRLSDIPSLKIPYSPLFELSALRGETIVDLSKYFEGLSPKEAREHIYAASNGSKELFIKQLNIYKQAKKAREIISIIKGQFERIAYVR